MNFITYLMLIHIIMNAHSEEQPRAHTQELSINTQQAEAGTVSPENNLQISEEEANIIYQKLLNHFNTHKPSRNIKNPWKQDEVKLLFWSVSKYCNERLINKNKLCSKDWEKISLLIPGRNITQCHYKWSNYYKHISRKMPWKMEEDDKLIEIIKTNGLSSWPSIASELNAAVHSNRHGKQCRERWLNHLLPTISKEPWKLEEDIKLLEAQKQYGNKWSEISRILSGRTENSVKNRFHCLLKKEKDEHTQINHSVRNISDAFNNVSNDGSTSADLIDRIINKKIEESSLLGGYATYLPLQEKINQEIRSFLSKKEATVSYTCPNFRFLLRRELLQKEAEKFINPITKQFIFMHPIGAYIENNNSMPLIRIL